MHTRKYISGHPIFIFLLWMCEIFILRFDNKVWFVLPFLLMSQIGPHPVFSSSKVQKIIAKLNKLDSYSTCGPQQIEQILVLVVSHPHPFRVKALR
jgi:hypothetical protein